MFQMKRNSEISHCPHFLSQKKPVLPGSCQPTGGEDNAEIRALDHSEKCLFFRSEIGSGGGRVGSQMPMVQPAYGVSDVI